MRAVTVCLVLILSACGAPQAIVPAITLLTPKWTAPSYLQGPMIFRPVLPMAAAQATPMPVFSKPARCAIGDNIRATHSTNRVGMKDTPRVSPASQHFVIDDRNTRGTGLKNTSSTGGTRGI